MAPGTEKKEMEKWAIAVVSSLLTNNRVSIPGSGRSPAGGSGNPLQYSRLEYLIGRGVWQTTVYRVTKSDITEHGMECV